MSDLRVLLIESLEEDVLRVERALREDGFEPLVQRVETAEAFTTALRESIWDVVLAEWVFPGFSTLQALAILRMHSLDLPFIVITTSPSHVMAVAAIKAGVHDIAGKEDLTRLAPAVAYELREAAERAARRAANEQTRQQALLLDQVHDAIICIDLQFCIQTWNAAAARIYGWRADEVIGKRLSSVIPVARYLDGQTPAAIIQAVFADGHWSGTVIHPHRDGHDLLIDSAVRIIHNEAGTAIGLVGVNRDSSERSRAEVALRASEERFRRLFEHSPDSMTLIDPHDADVPWRIVDCNTSACRLNGYTREELLGLSSHALYVAGTTWPPDSTFLGELREAGELHGIDAHRRKDGSTVPVEYSTALITVDGRELILGIDRDISERLQAEEERRRSEAYFRALIEHAADMISVIDRDGTIRYTSPAQERLLGFQPVECEGTPMSARIHPDDIDKARPQLTMLLDAPGSTVTAVLRSRHRNGTWRILESTATNLLDDPDVNGIVINSRDITERTRAEEQLRESEEIFRGTFEYSAIGMSLAAPDGRWLQVNPALCEMTGYTAHELLSRTFQDSTHPDDREADAALIQQLLACDIRSYQLETRYLHRQGHSVWVLLTRSAVRDGQGNLRYFITQVQDITARKQAEATLARYRLLFEQSRDPMLFVRMRDGRIVEANQAALMTYGYTRDELLARAIADVCAPKTQDTLHTQMTEADSGGTSFETTHIARDGRIIPVEVSSAGSELDGERVLLSVIRDLTARRAAEAQIHLQSTALAAAANGIMITDRTGTIVWTNPAFTQLTGYSAEEAVGQTPRLLKSGIQDELLYRDLWTTISRGNVWRGELINRRKDGSLYHDEMTITPVRDAAGEVTHFVAIKQDVTAREQRAREQAVIVAVAGALRAAHTRDEMLPVVVEQTRRLLSADAAALVLRDDATDEATFVGGTGVWAALHGVRLAPGTSATGRVITTGMPYVSRDASMDPHFNDPALLYGMRTLLGVPLIARTGTIGVLWAGFGVPRAPDDTRLLAAIADIAANAIQRTTLHEQTLRRLDHLTALRTIDQAINGSHDLQTWADVLLEQVCTQLQVDAACLLRCTATDPVLVPVAARGFRTNAPMTVRLGAGMGIAGRALATRRTVAMPRTADWQDETSQLLRDDEGFVACYAVPLISDGEVRGVLEIFHRATLAHDAEWLDFLETLAGQAALALDNASLFTDLQQSNAALLTAYDATIEGWSRALDLRDKETEGHSRRVTDLTVRLARVMGIHDDLVHIRRGALLHDIGKMGVPDRILLKPGPLTDDEWVIMRQHPVYAERLLRPIAFLLPALDIPASHHEKWDGSGYPQGLQGEQIPLAARIFAIVDVYDALTSDRPYRPAWPVAQVRAHLRAGAGTHFDPTVVDAFERLLDGDE